MNDYMKLHDLYHSGIKGMKWGIRRFQNEDGSLTEAGKARYGVGQTGEMTKEGRKQYLKDKSDPSSLLKEDIGSTVSTVVGGVRGATNAAREIPIKKGGTVRKTYPELSDQELQKRVNRISLEQRYSDLVGDTKYVKTGSEKAMEILQTIGAVVGIAAGLSTAALKVAEHFGGKKKKG